MIKHDLARIFNEIGLLLELKGENPFKVRAYYNAARTIESLDQDLNELICTDSLGKLPGFGEALIKKVTEWSRTGTIGFYEDLKNTTPPGLFELLRVPGLGPKKINQIYNQLGVTSLEMLEEACRQNRLAVLAGFGPKTQEKICAGIQFITEHRGQFLRYEALPVGIGLREKLQKLSAVKRVELAGSLRRCVELVKDIDLVAGSCEPGEVSDLFAELSEVRNVIAKGPTKVSVTLQSGINADLRIVKPEEFSHAWQHFTGSKEHNVALRHLAKERGFKVNEYGLEHGEDLIFCQSEAEIYQYLGLAYIPPELREGYDEIEIAAKGELPQLVELPDLQGALHIHTTYSDGAGTLRDMVQAAVQRGYYYIGISDHSQIAVYAHGLTWERLQVQFREIDQLNQEFPKCRIFKGIEADILPSGELDYDQAILAQFDFVIGSIHSRFQMDAAAMTNRILKAMENPLLTILGHPTGRILLGRSGYQLDLEAIIKKAAETGVAIEFNANPHRLDLDWRWCRRAKTLGVPIVINSDAHSSAELDLIPGGLAVARKAWLTKQDILNCRNVTDFQAYLIERKARYNKIVIQNSR